MPRIGRDRGAWVLAVAAGAALLLSACSGITIREAPASQPAVVLTARTTEIDLAVSGVTFQPAVGPTTRGSLIAVIENRGTQRVRNVLVLARLYGADGMELLGEQQATIEHLAGGETRAISFADVPEVPLRNRYRLTVEVPALEGEVDLTNNRRTFDLQTGLNSR